MSPAPILFPLIASLILCENTLASSFTPNCTLSPDHTNYVSGPNVRSTLSILWNCISIIFLCTWNILHLNVPAIPPARSSTVQKLWGVILDSRTKAKWMIATILMPEILVGKALDEFLSARAPFNNELARLAMDDGTEWGLTHAYFANLGGFVLDFTEILDQQSLEMGPDEANALVRLADELVLERVLTSWEDKMTSQRMRHKTWALTASQILEARKLGLIQTLPQVSGRKLEMFNKWDILVKFLALVQVSWLIIQLIARKIARLPSSQLEIAALAFSACSVVTYFLYWSRPQGVEAVWVMKASRLPTKQEMKSLVDAGPVYFPPEVGESRVDNDYDLVQFPNSETHQYEYFDSGLVWGSAAGGTVFGGLFCLAWKFVFPTPIDALIWRVCSIMTTVLPLISIPLIVVFNRLRNCIPMLNDFINEHDIWGSLFITLYIILYVLARLFLMIEIFRTLFFLPPKAFIDTWSGTFPHWG